jgi:predicted amidohydrolase
MLTRVAVVQFQAGTDVVANLTACQRLIDEAARHRPALIVLPEFCNHAAHYKSPEHGYAVAAPLAGEFLKTIAAKAQEHHCHLVVHCSVQRAPGKVTATSLMYDPTGELMLQADRQVLLGHEKDFFEGATAEPAMATTPFGNVGLYCGADGRRADIPRGLAVRGAQVLCHSLSTPDAPVAARAAENRVFVLAANAGASQIIAPDGTRLAQAARSGEEVLWAEIDVAAADHKKRPDGTDVFAQRRPGLYPTSAQRARATRYPTGAATLEAAVYQPHAEGVAAIDECAGAVGHAVQAGAQLIILPELFCFEYGLVKDPYAATDRSVRAIEALTFALHDTGAVVATSLVERGDNSYQHMGVIIGRKGVLTRQPQLHLCQRHARWCAQLGKRLDVTPMPWGRLALVVGDDAVYPETFRLAARHGADVAAVPFQILEKWEVELGLSQRVADNLVCLAAATRPTRSGASALITCFSAGDAAPHVVRASPQPGLTHATLHPAHARTSALL